MKFPAPDFSSNSCDGFLAKGRTEVDKMFTPTNLGPSSPKGEAKGIWQAIMMSSSLF